jgi:hypothetical protein
MARPTQTPLARRNMLIIRLVALVLFAAAAGGIWWYQLAVARPKAICAATPGGEWNDKARSCRVPASYTCEKNGGWWEPTTKVCAKVINIPQFTGRQSKQK